MAITIRERNLKRNSPANPQLIEVSLDTVDGGSQRLELRLGYDAEALSWFYRFTLERRAEIRVRRFSDDPYAVHLGVTLTPVELRNGQVLVGTTSGDSGWVVLPAGTYRMVAAMTFIGALEAVLLFEARPRRVQLLSDAGVDDSADCIALASRATLLPMSDVRTVERFRDLNLDIEIDQDQLFFDFSGWEALLVVYTGNPLSPLHSQLLDPVGLADGRFVVTVDDNEVATWPDQVNALILGTGPSGLQITLLIGDWAVVDPPGGPGYLEGLPAIDNATIDRHATLVYVMQLWLSGEVQPADLSGWSAWLDIWSDGYVGLLALAAGDMALVSGAAVFDVASNITTAFPDVLNARGWLVDPDGGTHWLIRGDWIVSQGYSRSGEEVVRDDRIVQRGETLDYRLRMLDGDGDPIDVTGWSGVLRLSGLDGSAFGNAADTPTPITIYDGPDGVLGAAVSIGTTLLLPVGTVAMQLLVDLPDGRTDVLMVAGVWTVSEGYSVP